MQYKYAEIADTVYFWFAANDTTGTAADGATPLYDVRLAGAAAGAAPTASGTPTLLTHANYSDGLHEIAIDTTGYAAGEYAVFCTLTVSTVNPAGFCGSFKLRTAGTGALNVNTTHVGGTAQTARDIGASVLLSSGTGTGQISLSSGAVLLQATQTGVTIPTVTTVTNAPTDMAKESTLGNATYGLNSLHTDIAAISAGGGATPAEVNAQVLDVLTTDTFAELSSVPSATSSIVDKINWLFMQARNKITQTSTTTTLRNDADDADVATSSVTKSSGTVTRGKWS